MHDLERNASAAASRRPDERSTIQTAQPQKYDGSRFSEIWGAVQSDPYRSPTPSHRTRATIACTSISGSFSTGRWAAGQTQALPDWWIVLATAALPGAGNFIGGMLAELIPPSPRAVNLALHAACGIVFGVLALQIMPDALTGSRVGGSGSPSSAEAQPISALTLSPAASRSDGRGVERACGSSKLERETRLQASIRYIAAFTPRWSNHQFTG